MTTLLYTHPSSLAHDTGPGHPEQQARAKVIYGAIEREEQKGNLADVLRREAPEATREQLQRVHDAAFVEAILNAVPDQGYVRIDADTVMSPASGEAALCQAGAVCAAVDAVIGGKADNAMCALRPPGHHAEPDRAMGFCLFNGIAIGAMHALVHHGLGKASIFDFDVHHGNGTQAAFEREPRVQYLSTHQWPLFPGTGAKEETGVGNIVNRPLPSGTGSRAWRDVVEGDILAAIDDFAPELVMISAGFDAHRADPLASLELVEDDFAWVTEELVALAKRHAKGRVVSVLEGGYDLVALTNSFMAHLNVLRTT
ncbi:MAG: histone deacetylase family protein [Alphaproteobacteria bacterium]|nr:histone deacetylase family protein [Alphaproteobacteria bacterium]